MSDFEVGAPKKGKGFVSSADSGGQEVSRVSPVERNQIEATEKTGRERIVPRTAREAPDNSDREPRGTVQQAAPVASAPASPIQSAAQQYMAQSAKDADSQRESYDQYTKAGMGASPAETMQLAQNAAQQTAQGQSDAAIRSAVKGAKTAGAMGGQAALAGSAQGADAYNQGLTTGKQQYFDTTKLGASLGSEMSSRLARAGQTEAGIEASKLAAKTQADASKPSGWDIFGNVLGGVGAVAGLFSDKNLKEGIEPRRMSEGLDKIRGYSYRYKGDSRPEAGVMAQDLEKGPMAPAVMETPKGKMIDTRRLSTMNTAALSEHEQRLKDIERMVQGLAGIRNPKGGK